MVKDATGTVTRRAQASFETVFLEDEAARKVYAPGILGSPLACFVSA